MLDTATYTLQRQRVLKARVALALYSEFGTVPQEEDVEHVYLLIRVLYRAVLDPILMKVAEVERISRASSIH
jgi:hypothetical protein